MSSRPGSRLIIFLLPLVTGFAYWLWLELAPKSWAGGDCGLSSTQVLLPAIACVVAPVTLDAARALGARRPWQAAALRAAGLGVLIVAALIVAFMLWFGAHRCGE